MPQPFFPLFISQTSFLPFTTSKKKKKKKLRRRKKFTTEKNTARDFFLLLRNVFVSMSKMFSRSVKKMKIRVIYFASAHYGFGVFHLGAPLDEIKKEDERETCIHNHQHPSIFNGVFHAFYLPFESIIHNNFQFHMRRGSSWGRVRVLFLFVLKEN